MILKEYEEKIIESTLNKFKSKREQLIDSQLKLIERTGKITANVNDILYLDNINERKIALENLKSNISELMKINVLLSDSIECKLEDIIKN